MSPVKPHKLELPIGFPDFLECVGQGNIGRKFCTSQHGAQSGKLLVFIASTGAPLIVWLA